MKKQEIKAEKLLEFDTIKEKLREYAHSETVAEQLRSLKPYMDEDACIRKNSDTTAARKLLDSLGSPPLPYSSDIEALVAKFDAGELPVPEQLTRIAEFAASCSRTKKYLTRAQSIGVHIASFGNSIRDLDYLSEEITRSIKGDSVDSNASTALKGIRRKIDDTESQIKDKVESVLKANRRFLSEDFVAIKNGHYVVPVKKKYRSQFDGSVIETSSSGGTCFMEPHSVSKIQDTLQYLQIEEDNEIRTILYTLAALVADHKSDITMNLEAVEKLDFIFAKGRLSQAMGATEARITTKRTIKIKQGRHPLLDAEECVPLDIEIDKTASGVIITGPNTGGKTVTLKTVGLLSLMAQSGLHIPAEAGSTIAMHSEYLCDIGDSQSITENLSTFSGHMVNVIDILKNVDSESLVILDELGSGTDPAEGMGIAIAVLEELRKSGCMYIVTTHYPQVKDYAKKVTGVVSARMAFDRETLSPLYKLEMGQLGESCALHIAEKLGLAPHILKNAHDEAYGDGNASYDEFERPAVNERSKIRKKKEEVEPSVKVFDIGDNVIISPNGDMGIVYRPADAQGDVEIQVKGEKIKVNHKRITLNIPAAELYPPDYDFSIIFDSVENRKARNKLDKGNPTGVIME